jgi:hypothetical protein
MNDVSIPAVTTGFVNPLDYINVSTVSVNGNIDNNYIEIEHQLKRIEQQNLKRIDQRLDLIEQLLNIINRDIGMEKKYPELVRLANEYTATLEKYKTWDNLNDDHNQRTR